MTCRRVHRQAAIARQRLEHADVVVAEVAREVFVARQRDAFLGQRLLKRLQVQRLAVGDDAVEVEDDGLQRGVTRRGLRGSRFGGAFSPARIGTLSRFAGGGYGHSYVGL